MPDSFANIALRTDRLLLRPLGVGDAGDLFAMFADPVVMRYWSSVAWTTMQSADEFIARDLQAMASGGYLRLGIVRRDDDRVIGQCCLFAIDAGCRRAEVGYALAASAWGRGYAHEALTAFLAHAFDTMGLNRIEADIDPRNAASARALERLGFVKEGHLRQRWIVGGETSDSALYGLLACDRGAR